MYGGSVEPKESKMKKFLISAAAIGLMTTAAYAAPTMMTNTQMDAVVAGGDVTNNGGQTVFTVNWCNQTYSNGQQTWAFGSGPMANGNKGGNSTNNNAIDIPGPVATGQL